MPKARPEELEEPRGKYFYEQPDLYCSYCNQLIEPEFQIGGPCHLCGEWRWLYEVLDKHQAIPYNT